MRTSSSGNASTTNRELATITLPNCMRPHTMFHVVVEPVIPEISGLLPAIRLASATCLQPVCKHTLRHVSAVLSTSHRRAVGLLVRNTRWAAEFPSRARLALLVAMHVASACPWDGGLNDTWKWASASFKVHIWRVSRRATNFTKTRRYLPNLDHLKLSNGFNNFGCLKQAWRVHAERMGTDLLEESQPEFY